MSENVRKEPPMSDIVERLLKQAAICRDSKTIGLITKRRSEVAMFEAADTITNLRAELAELQQTNAEQATIIIGYDQQLVEVRADDATVERYRHKKRGTVYEVIGSAELQVAGLAPDEGDHLAVYRGEDGKLWARPYDEFHDGRFEALSKGPKA